MRVIKRMRMFGRASRFLSVPERLIVIEVLHGVVFGTVFSIRLAKRHIAVLEHISLPCSGGSCEVASTVASMVRKLRWRPIRRHARVIVSFASRYATTVHDGISLIRDKPKQPIDEPDLHNRIGQGMWRLFDRQRSVAAAKMGVREFEVLLTDTTVKRITLDSHRVVNPLGFSARAIELYFSQTLMPKPFVAELAAAFEENDVPFAVERGAAITDIVARAFGGGTLLLADIADDHTDFFVADGGTITHLDSIRWGRMNFIEEAARVFAVSKDSAWSMFGRVLTGDASAQFLRYTEYALLACTAPFTAAISEYCKRYGATAAYLTAPFLLPEFLFGNSFRNKFTHRVRVFPVSTELATRAFGFTFDAGGRLPLRTSFATAAIVLEVYTAVRDDRMSKIARRQASWIAT